MTSVQNIRRGPWSLLWRCALCATLSACAAAAPPPLLPPGQPVPLQNPSFNPGANGKIEGWTLLEHMTGNSYTFVADGKAAHSAPASMRIRRHGKEFYGLAAQTIKVRPEWINKTVRLSGFLKTSGATGTGAGLVLQARSGIDTILANDHMNENRVKGTQGWKRYSISMRIPPGTWALQVGAMLEDDGTLWVDDLALAVLD